MIIVSACLLETKCRFDGKCKTNDKVMKLVGKEILFPVCPEQLGGLPTPREPAEQRGGKVFTISGRDVTDNFQRGAEQVLQIAKLFGVRYAILKQKSPSCGVGEIYNGYFSGTIIPGDGVTTTLLKQNGIKVISDEDL